MVIIVASISKLFILQTHKINFQHKLQLGLGYVLNKNNEPVNQFCAFPILWQLFTHLQIENIMQIH